jgi:hypothetical protein
MAVNKKNLAKNKTFKVRMLIQSGLEIIKSVGVPTGDLTLRRLEKMSMALLALCAMEKSKKWADVSSIAEGHILRTREIITYLNKHFEENISLSSYDDIRRKDLIRLVGMGLVVKSANNPNADTNDGTRGYAVEEKFSDLIRCYGSEEWNNSLNCFELDQDYIDQFHSKRQLEKLEVHLEEGVVISLDKGPHNKIQKAIIEEFLPIYGYDAKVLYIGDTSTKHMHEYSDEMIKLGLNIENRGMLPDIVAFSSEKQWLYLIEAVHSSNPLNPERCIELQRRILKDCPYGVVFITAFLSKKEFAKWLSHIAWETEVWLVDTPQHLIHFNGDKFLGPHKQTPKR